MENVYVLVKRVQTCTNYRAGQRIIQDQDSRSLKSRPKVLVKDRVQWTIQIRKVIDNDIYVIWYMDN